MAGTGVLLALSAGVYAITYALRQTNLKITTHDRSFWLLLALLAYPIVRVLFLLTLDLMNGEVNFFNLYYLTMKNQAVSIALLGMTGALLVRYYFRGPWKAWLAAIPALALLCLQSPYFGTAFAHDPFAAKPALLTYRSMALSPLKQSEAPATAYGLRLAPGAGRLAYLKTTIDAENEEAKSFIVADFHQHASELAADDLVFVDDRLLLTNTEYPNSLKLWQFTNDSWRQAKTWQLPEAFISTKLRWLDAQKIWELEGLDYAENAIVKLSGQLNNDQYQVNQYRQTDRPPKANFIWLENDLLSVKLGRKHLNNSAILAPLISFFRADHQSYHEFWRHAQKPHKIATSAVVNLRCDHPLNADGASLITCLYKIDGFTRLSLLNLNTAHLDATVELNDKDAFYNLAGQQNGFVLVTKNSMQLLAVDIRNKTAVALASDNIALPIQSTAFSEKFAALSFYTGDAAKQIVQLYNLDALKRAP